MKILLKQTNVKAEHQVILRFCVEANWHFRHLNAGSHPH